MTGGQLPVLTESNWPGRPREFPEADLPTTEQDARTHRHPITHFHWHPALQKEEINNVIHSPTLGSKEVSQFFDTF